MNPPFLTVSSLPSKYWPVKVWPPPIGLEDPILVEPICLADDLDEALGVRFDALVAELGYPTEPPFDAAFVALAFRTVPGLWPVGWGPEGPLRARGAPGRPKRTPSELLEHVSELEDQGFTKKEAMWAYLATLPAYKGMSPSAIASAYSRAVDGLGRAPATKLRDAFGYEDTVGEALEHVLDDDLHKACFQNWVDWQAVLLRTWPEQADVFKLYPGFVNRPLILSRYVFSLRNLES